ncbi:uncharacterized protein TNCT_36711 [Trichonephila clavata]|uniref:Uncharacterized protein n=1 Tax=Trichonephila clavata TaxID=2740835 RepID=A0A8X6HMW7_TRICU|nr:uncharacterized protein TNCT_36711 [Trichonephila clavata]
MNKLLESGSPNFAVNIRHNLDPYRIVKVRKNPVRMQVLKKESAPLTRFNMRTENKFQNMRKFNRYGDKQKLYRKNVPSIQQIKRHDNRLTLNTANRNNLYPSLQSLRHLSNRNTNPNSVQSRGVNTNGFRTIFHRSNTIKDLTNARPIFRRQQNIQRRGRTFLTTEPDFNSEKSRSKKSPLQNSFINGTLHIIELFFIFIPVASLTTIVFSMIHYCWRKGRDSDTYASSPSKDMSESMVGSAIMNTHKHGKQYPLTLTKSQTEIWRNLIENEIDGDGDRVGKRMKLERWMYQKCDCCPDEEAEPKKKKSKREKRRTPKGMQSQANKQREMNNDNKVPTPSSKSNSPRKTPIMSPFSSSNKLKESAASSQYSIPWSAGDDKKLNSLYTFDSHAKFPQEGKEKKHRIKSKSKKSKENESKDTGNKNMSELFNL